MFPHVRRTADQLACDFGIRTVGGHRRSAGDHGRGLAVDFMTVNTAQGDRLAAQARANASRYGIQYVMWNHRIWSAGRADEGWRWVPDRGDRTANHMDHVHVSFSATPGNAVLTRATASQAPAERRAFT